MAENIQQTSTKYLDLVGLQKLWEKIGNLYPRTSNLVSILDALENPYIHKSVYDEDLKNIEEQLSRIEAGEFRVDGDTIWYNPTTSKHQTNLILDLDTDKQTIRLVTKDPSSPVDAPKAKTIISEIDYKPFVKDGMLDTVSIVVIPDDEAATETRPAGTYLKFVFNTSAGKNAIYLNTNEFGNTYVGSDYIIIQNNKILLNTVKLDAHIEEYISTQSVTISGIKTQISELQTINSQYGASINNLTTEFNTIQTSFIELNKKVEDNSNRILAIENTLATIPTEPITSEEIDNLQ